jgi:hypothetical protein
VGRDVARLRRDHYGLRRRRAWYWSRSSGTAAGKHRGRRSQCRQSKRQSYGDSGAPARSVPITDR